MVKNTLTTWPTGWNWEKLKKFSHMSDNISSVLQDKEILEDPQRVKNFWGKISGYIVTCCHKYPATMKTITKDELVEKLKKKFIKNFKKMTQSTANKKIEEAVNNFVIKRMELLKTPNWWDYYTEENRVGIKHGRYWKMSADSLEEFKRTHKLKLAESELDEIIDNRNKAKDIMRNLDKYILNLDLAKSLAKAWVFHLSDLFPSVYVDSNDHVHVIGVDYSDFWITKDDVNFLCSISYEISKEKDLKHWVFTLEDEIDEHFWN